MMKKTMKKIASIGIASTMVAATLAGAMAADLKDLPAPFVKNGAADFRFVIGAKAATIDVIGAVDMATSFQADSYEETAVEVPGTTSRTISGGAKVEQAGNHLLLGKALYNSTDKFDKNDLPELLADGTVLEEDDAIEYDYSQELALSTNTRVRFDRSDSDVGDDPVVYLDLDNGESPLWNYTVDFKGKNLDVTNITDSESIVLLGKTFTFDPKNTATSEIKLFGSDVTKSLAYGDSPITVTVDGKTYTVAVTGGSTADSGDKITVSVNGQGQTLIEGQSKTINGLKVYAKTVTVNEQPVFSAAGTLFIGSGEIKLPTAASTCSLTSVQIGGKSLSGMEACVINASAGGNFAIDKIIFSYKPADLNGDVAAFDQTNFLKEGDKISDPLFGTFNVLFSGATSKADDESKTAVKFRNSGSEFELTFQNKDGETTTFRPFKLNSSASDVQLFAKFDSSGQGYNGTTAAQSSLYNKQVFILNEGTTEITSRVFEVSGFATENSVAVVRLKNLGTGDTTSYAVGDKVIDGVTVGNVNVAGKLFNLSAATTNQIYLKGGKDYIILDSGLNTSATATKQLNLTEVDKDEATAATVRLLLTADSTDSDIKVSVASVGGLTVGSSNVAGNYWTASDKSSKKNYYLTQYGTYVVEDKENYNEVNAYVPAGKDAEVSYDVFFAPTAASVSASGSSVKTKTINKIAVGITLLDSDITLATAKTNLIVVGGPCANSVAQELLKSKTCTEGFTTGKARIELFDLDTGKVAMLVAGYDATGTQAASRAVASKNANLKGKSAVLAVTSASEFTVTTQVTPTPAPAGNTS